MPNLIGSRRRSFCLFYLLYFLSNLQKELPTAHPHIKLDKVDNHQTTTKSLPIIAVRKQPGNACLKGKIRKGGKQGRKGGRSRRAGLLYWRTGAVDEAP